MTQRPRRIADGRWHVKKAQDREETGAGWPRARFEGLSRLIGRPKGLKRVLGQIWRFWEKRASPEDEVLQHNQGRRLSIRTGGRRGS